MSEEHIHPIGETVWKPSKLGGGEYTIIDHVECERCEELLEEREVVTPNKRQRKNGSYYAQYSWCHKCGLYTPNKSTKTIYERNGEIL